MAREGGAEKGICTININCVFAEVGAVIRWQNIGFQLSSGT